MTEVSKARKRALRLLRRDEMMRREEYRKIARNFSDSAQIDYELLRRTIDRKILL